MKPLLFSFSLFLVVSVAMPAAAASADHAESRGATTCGLNFRHSSAYTTCAAFDTEGSSWAGCVINAKCQTKWGNFTPTSIKLPERQVRDLLNCNGTLKLKC